MPLYCFPDIVVGRLPHIVMLEAWNQERQARACICERAVAELCLQDVDLHAIGANLDCEVPSDIIFLSGCLYRVIGQSSSLDGVRIAAILGSTRLVSTMS